MTGIDNIRSGQTLTTTRNTSRQGSDSSVRSESSNRSASPQDAVSLSKEGKAIGQMHQDLASQPSFDSAKVAAIKDAIANGSYKVDPEKLADNMIKYEQELGGF